MAYAALLVLVLVGMVGPVFSDKHSLYYIYSSLNRDVNLPGIYEFTALGLLDDREIDYYNSKEQKKIPKQDWMMEKMQDDYWEKGTQSRKSKEQWFKVNVDILMKRMNHSKTGLHVLQWRHGCEIEESNGEVTFLRGIDEYSYDGSEFLSFDDENMRWIAPVQAAVPTKMKWDGVAILNQYTKGYLEKECVDWLTKFMEYGKESQRNHSAPEVYAFEKKSVTDPGKLTLTCLATGFYPKDVKLCLRKFRTSVPEHMLTSSGIRPNDDGTYQLRKSVEIQEDDKGQYDCYVSHSSLSEPVIKPWVPKNCGDSVLFMAVGAGIGGVLLGLILIILAVLRFRKSKPAPAAQPLLNHNGNPAPAAQPLLNHNGNPAPAAQPLLNHNGNPAPAAQPLLNHNGNPAPAAQPLLNHNGNPAPAAQPLLNHNGNPAPAAQPLLNHNGNPAPVARLLLNQNGNPAPAAQPLLNPNGRDSAKSSTEDLHVVTDGNGRDSAKSSTEDLHVVTDGNAPPKVHVFATKSIYNPRKLTLTCLATGFYPKDVELCVRKFGTSIPEHMVTSSGVRPNDDGTYQLRKSVEINGDDPADYDCYVTHRTLEKPVIKNWGRDSAKSSTEDLHVVTDGNGNPAPAAQPLLNPNGNPAPAAQPLLNPNGRDSAKSSTEDLHVVTDGNGQQAGESDSGIGSATPRSSPENTDSSSESGSSSGGSPRGSVANVGAAKAHPQQHEQEQALLRSEEV